jgi:hypothetical protein
MMDSYFWLLLALVAAMVAGLLLGSVVSCEPEEVIVQIEFPSKKEDRIQQYWFLTVARGYSI